MKKILSLFVLLVAIVTGAKADDVYKFQLNGSNKEIINGTTTSGDLQYFSYNSGKHNFNSKFTGCTYDGVSYTSGLKMEGATQVSWTSTQTSTVTIVQSSWQASGKDLQTIKFDNAELATSGGVAITGGVVYTISNVAAGAHSVTRGSGESGVFAIYVTEASSKTVTGVTLDGVKIDGSTATETTDYTISGTTITLTGSYSIAPEVSLIEKTTYDEGDPTTKDIAVTFTKGETYFTGTATIGADTDYETDYTVQVPVSTAATLELSATSVDVTLKSYEVVKANGKNLDPVKVTLTGANLADGEYNVSAEGLTISPSSFVVENGAVSQEFSINTTSTTAASTEINFTVGELTETFTLNLTRPAKRSVTQSVVTEATTWDWANASSEEVLLTKVGGDDYTFATDPARDVDFLMATLPEVNNDANFNSQALVLNTQYVKRDGDYFQGSSVAFKTNLSGQYKVTVKFANTGKRDDTPANRRYLYIDGTNTDEYTLNTDWKTATATLTLDGDEKEIVINAFTGAEEPAATMVRIKEITFAPAAAQDITVGETGFATVGLPFATTVPEGVTAYAVESVSDSKVKMSDAIPAGTTIPANKGFVIVAAPNTYTFTEVATAEYEGTNLLEAVGATPKAATTDAPIYVLTVTGENKVGFKKATSGSLGAYKAYLPGTVSTLSSLSASFDDDPTAVDAIAEANEADAEAPVKVIKNGKLFIGNYNVAGQLVK